MPSLAHKDFPLLLFALTFLNHPSTGKYSQDLSLFADVLDKDLQFIQDYEVDESLVKSAL